MESNGFNDSRPSQFDWLVEGLKQNKIMPYPDSVIDALRPYSFGGMPLHIYMLISDITNGNCYDMAKMMQLAFDDCKVVYADVETLRRTYGEKEAEHAYIEINDLEDPDKAFVVDTSLGIICDKEYFDEYEKPKVNCVLTKKQCMQTNLVKQILAADFEKEKWTLLLTLPHIEEGLDFAEGIGTLIYKDKIREEIAKLKQAINFDAMEREYQEDIDMIGTNPQALEDKFKIVRDDAGIEISRGGVKNPYYKFTKKILAEPAEDGRQKSVWGRKLRKISAKITRAEDREVARRAARRLREIKKNPTQNIYSQPGE